MAGKLTLIILLNLLCVCGAFAQTTAFTYQGRLTEGGGTPTGQYDFTLSLYDVAGNLVGSVAIGDVQVTNGVFTVNLDFGSSPFTTSSASFLEIGVRPGASTGAYTTLSPRQPITSSPYSVQTIRATTAAVADNSLQLGGLAANQYVTTTNANATFVTNTDPRLSDARSPLANSGNYIQNTAKQQALAQFNVAGPGTIGNALRVEGSGVPSTAPSASFSSSGTFQVDAPFVQGGRLNILNNGNVGINNTDPAEKLDVSGNIKFSGTITGNGSELTNLKVGSIKTEQQVAVAAGSFISGQSSCPIGMVAIGGGYTLPDVLRDSNLKIVESRPSLNNSGWVIRIWNPETFAFTYTVWATCVK
jgi:hypothetical protein